MDIITQTQATQVCHKHSNKKVEFLQVNNLQNSQNSHLFYCTSCINKDLAFQGINYLLVSQVVEEGETNIIQKWPPINDYSVIDRLISFTETQDSSTSVVHQINLYFAQFKEEFLKKVDLCEKKMINRALELPLGKDSILTQYQQISSIIELRNILIEGGKKDAQAHEQLCRKFVTEVESQKEKNSQLLEQLLQQCDQKEQLVDFEFPNKIKDSVFSFIDQIDFFNSTKKVSNQDEQKALNSSKLVKLISNKSNFCSAEFLSQLQVLLDKINPVLSIISFDNIHERNKRPIDFSTLSQQRFGLVESFVDHQIRVEQSKEFTKSIENQFEYQQMEKILESNVNFVSNNLKAQLKSYIIDSYPLLKQVNFSNAVLDNDKFDCFRQLTEMEIMDIFNLVKKKQTLNGDHEYNGSETILTKNKIINVLNSYEDSEEILRKYPIFDLMKKKENKQFSLPIKLTKTSWQNGNNRMDIFQDTELKLTTQGEYVNCVSDIILEKEKKYVFRFSIQDYNGEQFMLGLMQNGNCDSEYGFENYLCCNFFHQNNQIEHYGGYGIDKYLKGDKLKLSEENEIEMRVWLGAKQLEILDYPHYQYKVGLKDEYKDYLIEQNDLKLYIAIYEVGINIVLTNAFQVDSF